jgi:hypothetical protein
VVAFDGKQINFKYNNYNRPKQTVTARRDPTICPIYPNGQSGINMLKLQ